MHIQRLQALLVNSGDRTLAMLVFSSATGKSLQGSQAITDEQHGPLEIIVLPCLENKQPQIVLTQTASLSLSLSFPLSFSPTHRSHLYTYTRVHKHRHTHTHTYKQTLMRGQLEVCLEYSQMSPAPGSTGSP